ncbi:MAG TPA: hypothetical protein VF132_15130 [Rudaea sp.]
MSLRTIYWRSIFLLACLLGAATVLALPGTTGSSQRAHPAARIG